MFLFRLKCQWLLDSTTNTEFKQRLIATEMLGMCRAEWMSQIVFIFGVYWCQVSRSCDLHLDITGVESLGNQWRGARTMCAQKLVPMHLQSSWNFSELGSWTAQCSHQGSRNTAGGVTPLLWAPLWEGRRRESKLLSLTDGPGLCVALCRHVCLFEIPIGWGMAKIASYCFRPWIYFIYFVVPSCGKQKYASLEAQHFSFVPGYSLNRHHPMCNVTCAHDMLRASLGWHILDWTAIYLECDLQFRTLASRF